MTDLTIDEQKQTQIKNFLFENFYNQYRTISDFVMKLPVADNLKIIILQKFDEGYLWTKEAFANMQVNAPANTTPDIQIVGIEDAKPQCDDAA